MSVERPSLRLFVHIWVWSFIISIGKKERFYKWVGLLQQFKWRSFQLFLRFKILNQIYAILVYTYLNKHLWQPPYERAPQHESVLSAWYLWGGSTNWPFESLFFSIDLFDYKTIFSCKNIFHLFSCFVYLHIALFFIKWFI